MSSFKGLNIFFHFQWYAL